MGCLLSKLILKGNCEADINKYIVQTRDHGSFDKLAKRETN